MGFGFGGHYRQGRSVRPEKMHSIKLSGTQTYVWTDDSGNTHVRLHDTDVVSFNDKWITLRTGGWKTGMTKGRMHWAAHNFDLGFSVGSESSRKRSTERTILTEGIGGDERQVVPTSSSHMRFRPRRTYSSSGWFVEFGGRWPFDSDTISLNRETREAVEEDMVDPTDDLYHCKRQKSGFRNPGRAHAMNIAMARDESSKPDDIDVEIEDQGSIILFRLATDAAKTWWKENVSPGQILGGRYVVEHRYADSVIEGMMSDGLNVR